MRSIWKGTISFGLINIPVGLYSVTKPRKVMHWCYDEDLSRARSKRVAESTGEEIPPEHLAKMVEDEEGEPVVLSKEELQSIEIPPTHKIDLKEFVNLSEVNPVLFDKVYYIAPDRGGDKGYVLLREVLNSTGKIGMAKMGFRNREHLSAIRPLGNLLILELMHYVEELTDPTELKIPQSAVSEEELRMSKALVGMMTGKWKPEKYKDEYAEALKNLIESKKGKLPPKEAKLPTPTKPIDMLKILQSSMDQLSKTEKEARMKSLPHPKLKLNTPLGQMEMTIENADRVTLRGIAQFRSSPHEVFTELKKSDGTWKIPDGSSARDEKFQADILQPIINSFQTWADTHPNIFQFAGRSREMGKKQGKSKSRSSRKV